MRKVNRHVSRAIRPRKGVRSLATAAARKAKPKLSSAQADALRQGIMGVASAASDVKMTPSEADAMRSKYAAPSLSTFQAYDHPVVLTKGQDEHVWYLNEAGKEVKCLDMLGQNLCVSVGHAHPKVMEAAVAQMARLPHATTMYHHPQAIALCKDLVERVPPHPSGEDYVVHLTCTGSEAVDLAIQMARVHADRDAVVSLDQAYHGLQGYAAGVTAIAPSEQKAYAKMFTGRVRLMPGDLDTLESLCSGKNGPLPAAFIAEPVQGYGGILELPKAFLGKAFDMINACGGVTIADEVQTGLNRTGDTFWGYEGAVHQAEPGKAVTPDIITLGKGIGNGIGIVSAVIARRSIADSFAHKMFFNTYASQPIACAAGRAVLEVLDDENIRENCATQGATIARQVGLLCEKYPQLYTKIRGRGLFQGLVIVNREHAYKLHEDLLFNHDIIIGRGSAAGNVFRIQPPMCISSESVTHLVESLDAAAKEYVKKTGI